jgi:hypothetical protein
MSAMLVSASLRALFVKLGWSCQADALPTLFGTLMNGI